MLGDLIRQGRIVKDKLISLVFVIADLGATDNEKKIALRFLKALRENSKYRMYISEIKVKGPKDTVSIEPNVFASDIKFDIL